MPLPVMTSRRPSEIRGQVQGAPPMSRRPFGGKLDPVPLPAPASPRAAGVRRRLRLVQGAREPTPPPNRPWHRAAPVGTRSGGRLTPTAEEEALRLLPYTSPSAPPSAASARSRSHDPSDGAGDRFREFGRMRPLLRGAGEGIPILLIHPAGSTASTWGSAAEELARIGRVITYDRRGYARSGGEPVRSISTHTADAAAIWSPCGPRPPSWSARAPGPRSPSTSRCVVRTWCGWSSPMSSRGGSLVTSYRLAGRGAGQDRIARAARPTGRRRRDIVARRLHLP